MPRSSPRLRHPAGPVLRLIAVLLLGIVPGCARPAARTEPSVALAPASSPTSDDASKVIEKRPNEPLASLLGRAPGVAGTLIDCVAGIYPTKIVCRRLDDTDSEEHYISFLKT